MPIQQKVKKYNIINTVNDIINKGRENEILHLYTQDEIYNGRIITLKGKEMVNFGSCSYLGLEIDDRLKAAAIDAVQKYGIQYSSSRSYVSCTLYSELETLMKKIFNAPVLLTPTTTLGHQAVISVVVEEGDCIILDQQVHASVQYAAQHMQLKGVPVSIIRHNNMEELEAEIARQSLKYNRIWYMADGIYSMYGDYVPVDKLIDLLDRYPQFHLYVDDAHGMSWAGKCGQGFVLSKTDLHPRMIVGASLAKAFGTGGGVFVFSDPALCQKVRNCGGPLIFSGPNQIPVIAASIASAKIHLSDEIYQKQEELKAKLNYCHELLLKHNLPVVSNPETPIKFIGLGLTRVGYNMVKRMLADACYCNLSIFPAVPETCTGLRFTITLHHTGQDIERMVEKLAYHFPKALANEGRSYTDIQRAFRKVASFREPEIPSIPVVPMSQFKIQHETSIKKIPEDLWNSLLGENGSYDWKFLGFLEQTFIWNAQPEFNWEFHYYIVRDGNDKPILATFFTLALNKDDMLSQAGISYQIEMKRETDPYYLCSKTLMMGSPLTEGQHIYIDRSQPDWKKAFMLLLDVVWKKQSTLQANSLCLRDFLAEDAEIQDFLMDQGFIKVNLPDNNMIDKVTWNNPLEFSQQFNAKAKKYLKDNVTRYEYLYEKVIVQNASPADIDRWYELYVNVKRRSFDLNTFDLPRRVFENMLAGSDCEVMEIRLKPEYTSDKKSLTVGVTFSVKTSGGNYCGVIIGLDYNYVKTHGLYKQVLYQFMLRAGELNAKKIFLGFTASDVKRKFGAKAIPHVAYVQMQDNFSISVINSIANTHNIKPLDGNSNREIMGEGEAA